MAHALPPLVYNLYGTPHCGGAADAFSCSAPVTLHFYYRLSGYDESTADIDPPDGPFANLRSTVDLGVSGCGQGTSDRATLVGNKGLLAEDLVGKRVRLRDSQVEVKGDCDPRFVRVDMSLRADSYTEMINDGRERNLLMTGSHGAYFENSADLVGVLVEDADGNARTDVEIVSEAGYVYPVLGEPQPEWTILSPTAALGTDLGTYSDAVPLEHTIDHSGLDKDFTSGGTDWDSYFALAPDPYAQGSYLNNWQSLISYDLPVQGTIDYDFGDVYRVDALAFWNRSLENVRALFASDPGGPWEEAGSFTLEDEDAYPYSYEPEIVTLDHEVEARYLRLAVDSTYLLSPSDSYAYAILGEIAARATSATVALPEPGAAAGIAALLALAGCARRARR